MSYTSVDVPRLALRLEGLVGRRGCPLSVGGTSVETVGQTTTAHTNGKLSEAEPAQGDSREPDLDLERYRGELTGYCYRMLGSAFDADDAVQECMVRAWQAADRFEGRSSVRSWLYRIATNVCLDLLRSRQRRALPMDLSSPVPSSTPPAEILSDHVWIEPVADRDVMPLGADPAEQAVVRDTVRLAFVAALQLLPPRQRAVLILREVLCWSAADVAELLGTTVASVNSALQRARATLAERNVEPGGRHEELDDAARDLLARYVRAFERYDIDTLVGLLHEDASFSMPPYAMWLRGPEDVRGWYLGYGIGCKGSRLLPLEVSGSPAFAQYKPSGPGGRLEPWCIQVLEIRDGRLGHIHHFVNGRLFERFGLPAHL
jgi:RNA polymerase sigma-70 factor, ECF subfamily